MIDFSNNNDYEFIDFPVHRGNSYNASADKYYIRISRYPAKDKSHKIVGRVSLSLKLTELLNKRGLDGFRIRKDKITGDMLLIFCKNREKQFGTITKGGKNCRTGIIQNIPFINFLSDELGFAGKELHSNVIELGDDMSNSDDYATFKLVKL